MDINPPFADGARNAAAVFFWRRLSGPQERVFAKLLFLVELSPRKIAQNSFICAKNACFLMKSAWFS